MAMNLKHVDVITLFVADVPQAKQFYQEIFELPVAFENEDSAVFKFGDFTINLLDVANAPDLIGPATVASQEAGPLAGRLINGPMDRWWGVRTAAFADPGGHIWEIAQDLPRAEGS